MPFCLPILSDEEEHSVAVPLASKLRYKRKLSSHRSTPFYNRGEVLAPQQNNEKEDLLQGETRQALSLVVNRLPVPIVLQPEITTVADLLSVFSRHEAMKIEAKNRGENHSMKTGELNSRPFSFRDLSERENNTELPAKRASSQLHVACRLPSPSPFVNRLLADGASPNQRNSKGQTPLHILVMGGIRNASARDALDCLLWRGASISCTDDDGDTPLLSVRHLLKEKQYETAVDVATFLLEAGADINSVDRTNQTLLSHSLQHLDSTIDLTKTLFNYGASVWGPDNPRDDNSAFKWLLKGIMRHRKLMNCGQTMRLIGQLMCRQPARMERLVIRTMTRNSTCYQVYGPIFFGIQQEMKKYWNQPQRLTLLCRVAARDSFQDPPSESVTQLSLPQMVKSYLLLNDESLGEQ